VPAEMSVVGYDDTADSAWYQPPLTTVRQDMRQLGECSVQWLTRQLEQPGSEAGLPPFATSLVVRASTAAPRDEQRAPHPVAAELRRLAQQLDNDVP